MSQRRSSSRPLRLCLTGGWFESGNVGDQAILAGLSDAFADLGRATLTVFTSDPARVARLHGLPAISARQDPWALARAIWRTDALIFSGGTPFYDAVKHMAYLGLLTLTARLRGRPVVVLGISLRTLNRPVCRWLCRSICRTAAYVGAREERSRTALEAFLRRPGLVRLCPDPGARLRPASRTWARAELESLGLRKPGLRIAVCLRDLNAPAKFRAAHYSRTFDRGDLDRLSSAVAGLCKHLVLRHRARVAFLPMHTEAPDDDRRPARACAALVGRAVDPSRIVLVEHPYGPRETKALLGEMDLVIGVRFHSLLLSASMGVPSYSLVYAPKTAALMELYGRGTHLQDIAGLDLARLRREVDGILKALPEQRRRLGLINRKLARTFEAEMERIARIVKPR